MKDTVLVFDMKRMQPACVLLQAAMGGSVEAASRFDSRLWLLAPTEDMRPYTVPLDLLPDIVAKVEKYHARKL